MRELKKEYKPLPDEIRQKRAEKFVKLLIELGKINFVTGVPCAVQKFIIRQFERERNVIYAPANIEREAIGIGAGASLAGKNVLIYMQNSGLLNSIHDINSLLIVYKIPVFLSVTWRGCPNWKGENAIHHMIDGKVMLDVLKNIGIKYWIISPTNMVFCIKRAYNYSKKCQLPVAFIIRRGVF